MRTIWLRTAVFALAAASVTCINGSKENPQSKEKDEETSLQISANADQQPSSPQSTVYPPVPFHWNMQNGNLMRSSESAPQLGSFNDPTSSTNANDRLSTSESHPYPPLPFSQNSNAAPKKQKRLPDMNTYFYQHPFDVHKFNDYMKVNPLGNFIPLWTVEQVSTVFHFIKNEKLIETTIKYENTPLDPSKPCSSSSPLSGANSPLENTPMNPETKSPEKRVIEKHIEWKDDGYCNSRVSVVQLALLKANMARKMVAPIDTKALIHDVSTKFSLPVLPSNVFAFPKDLYPFYGPSLTFLPLKSQAPYFWAWHVAPVVRYIDPDLKSPVDVVLDPVISPDGPILLQQWLNSMMFVGSFSICSPFTTHPDLSCWSPATASNIQTVKSMAAHIGANDVVHASPQEYKRRRRLQVETIIDSMPSSTVDPKAAAEKYLNDRLLDKGVLHYLALMKWRSGHRALLEELAAKKQMSDILEKQTTVDFIYVRCDIWNMNRIRAVLRLLLLKKGIAVNDVLIEQFPGAQEDYFLLRFIRDAPMPVEDHSQPNSQDHSMLPSS